MKTLSREEFSEMLTAFMKLRKGQPDEYAYPSGYLSSALVMAYSCLSDADKDNLTHLFTMALIKGNTTKEVYNGR